MEDKNFILLFLIVTVLVGMTNYFFSFQTFQKLNHLSLADLTSSAFDAAYRNQINTPGGDQKPGEKDKKQYACTSDKKCVEDSKGLYTDLTTCQELCPKEQSITYNGTCFAIGDGKYGICKPLISGSPIVGNCDTNNDTIDGNVGCPISTPTPDFHCEDYVDLIAQQVLSKCVPGVPESGDLRKCTGLGDKTCKAIFQIKPPPKPLPFTGCGPHTYTVTNVRICFNATNCKIGQVCRLSDCQCVTAPK